MSPFITIALAAIIALTIIAALARSAAFAGFVGVLLGMNLLITAALEPRFVALAPLAWYLQAASTLHFAALLRPRLRGTLYRTLLSLPAHVWMAGTFLAFPWAIVSAMGLEPHGWWLPFLIALACLPQSLRARRELVQIRLDGSAQGDPVQRSAALKRYPLLAAPAVPQGATALHIVQITDPHLGPFMSEARLRGICQRAVELDPELVLLTGDFYTMEGSGTQQSLRRAMEPLKELPGRVFACRGNHDLEVPELVAAELQAIGARLLIDEAERVSTSIGVVEIVGIDHIWRGRRERFAAVFAPLSRGGAALRLVLLHDPTGFAKLPTDCADLVLSGHTHGGHLGLVSLGLSWTSIGGLMGIPDHGLWSKGTARLYVHRANGHYGFPLRIGVPAEESLLRLELDR